MKHSLAHVSVSKRINLSVIKQAAQLSQKDHAAGWVSYGQKWKTNWETIFYGRSFKVIEVGVNRKRECDFLLVINSNLNSISYRFGVIAAYCPHFGHFAFSALYGELRDNVR